MRRSRLLQLALAASVLAVYAQATGFGFVDYDDGPYVTEVERVREGLSAGGVLWAFSAQHGVVWQPTTWLSHMLDFTLFGADPAGHHASSVLLHLANALLLFGLLRRLSGQPQPSAFAAALFALHPLHVESVAWVAERKDVLSTCFGLLALYAYAGWTQRRGPLRYAVTAALLALGLMAKPTLVTWPCVFLLLDHWPLSRLSRWRELLPRVVEKLPFFALAAITSVITLVTQQEAMQPGRSLPLTLRLANAVLAYASYLRKAFWPSDLAVHYPHPYIPGTGGEAPGPWVLAGCLVLLAGLTWLAVRPGAPRSVRVGWLWYLGTLVPMLGLVQVGIQAYADRYSYIPLVGLAIAVAWGGRALLARTPRGGTLAPGLALAASLACALLAYSQARSWRDSMALFENAVAVHPRSAAMNLNLGKAYEAAGRLDEAMARYRVALRVNPDYAAAHFNLGNAERARGDLEAAATRYRQSLAIVPGDPKVLSNLAGVVYLQGDAERAAALYAEVLGEHPDDPVALLSLAGLRRGDGDLEGAIALTRRAVAAAPRRAAAHYALGSALGQRGDLEAAAAHLARALELDPAHAAARERLELAQRTIRAGAR